MTIDLGSDRRGAAASARMEAEEIAKRRRQGMIRIAITAAYHATRSTMPVDAPAALAASGWPPMPHPHSKRPVLDCLRAVGRRGTFLLSRTSRPFISSLEEPLSLSGNDAQTLLTCLRRAVEELDSVPDVAVATNKARRVLSSRRRSPRRFLMSKIALAIGLAGLRGIQLSCHRTAWPFLRSVSLRRRRR